MLEKPFVDNTFGDFTKCGKNTNGSAIGKITLVIGLKNRSDVRQFPDLGVYTCVKDFV